METTKKPTPIAIIPISSIAVQFRDLVAEPDGAITSDFTFESSLRLCPERYCLSDFSQSRWGQSDVEGAAIVRALSNDPTGGLERFQSANQTCPLHDQHLRQFGNLESPVLLQQPQDRELRNRQPHRRQVAIGQAAKRARALPGWEGVTEIRSVWCCHPADSHAGRRSWSIPRRSRRRT